MLELDQDLLVDLAGWAALKKAKLLLAAGSVLKADCSPPGRTPLTLRGVVVEGRKKLNCGLIVRSAGDADNLCRCQTARRGAVCEHSVALGLAVLRAGEGKAEDAPAPDSGAERDAAPETSAIPARLPLEVERHPKREKLAVLRRPPLPGYRFVRGRGSLALQAPDGELRPTGYADMPAGFQREIEPLLADAEVAASGQVPVNWLRINGEYVSCMFHVESSDGLIDALRLLPGEPRIRLQLEGSLNRIDWSLAFRYPSGTSTNPELEREALARLRGVTPDAYFAKNAPQPPGRAALPTLPAPPLDEGAAIHTTITGHLRGENAILEFYAGPLDQIGAEGHWEVQIGERFARITREIEKIRPQVETISRGGDWLNFDLRFETSGGEGLAETEIRRLLQTGQSRSLLPSGKKVAIDRRCVADLYRSLEEVGAEQGAGGRHVRASQKFYVEHVLRHFTHIAELGDRRVPEAPGLAASLRPYQLEALGWLYERLGSGHGAILADEMGLGKTVQTLAVIAAIKASAGRPAPVLVVAPTSLLATWRREVERFLPESQVLTLHGPGRAKYFEVLGAAAIVLTSYASLVRDHDRYPADLEFALVVADEASYLKNPKTATAKAVQQLCARARLALTGTPIENRLQDLWSIMQFANPGYLGRREDFVARYPDSDPEAARQLRRRIEPFLLRRTKAAVAKDLPEKIERVLFCELSKAQRQTYDQLLRLGRKKLGEMQSDKDWQAGRMELLTLLLRLRQCCGDLRLLKSDLPGKKPPESGKLEALATFLEAAIPAGHRVLLFSQFVSMLALVRGQLDAEGVRYAYLDGSTPADERAAQVEAFQAPEGRLPIFLISLKAGGYGLTLTAADTVVHLDPWWNPAVEAQATDRAHRIGQTRPVTAYKFIASGTIEEKILELQKRKRLLIDTALDEASPLMSSLQREDLEFVLS